MSAPIRAPIAAVPFGKANALAVVCDDGTAWLWTAPIPEDAEGQRQYALDAASGRISDRPHTWVQFHTPIPGSRSDAAYQEVRS